MAQNHYETLGVARDASNEEIKAAFLKLSKTNHPDIAGVANTSRFQEISNAAGVLCDKAKRESYDLSLRGGTGPIYSPASVFGKNRPPPRGNGQNLSGFEETLQSALRPRHLLIGGIGMFILASVVNYLEGDKNNNSNNRMNQSQFLAPHRRQSNQLVQAWMNPQTGTLGAASSLGSKLQTASAKARACIKRKSQVSSTLIPKTLGRTKLGSHSLT